MEWATIVLEKRKGPDISVDLQTWENEKSVFVEEKEAVLEEEIEENNEEAELEEYKEAAFEKNRNTVLEENREIIFKLYTSQFLTTNERHVLLFNVGELFEVSMDDFDHACLDHTHTLGESEVLKRSNAVRKLVEEEAVKNYPPPTIISAIKDYATKKLDLGTSVKELK
ncbi:38323_t:CDS:2 [Gigaspora margarita]|uniref:38323_t:CDS:1 n=1 Tax=Gigaspora margarita TaxID=4874 RepID=A0ABN7UFJ8_GIGMA|nr:38323_t:CDS:2 [Gigaspora margarita]